MNDLRKFSKDGTQRRCNGCFEFFNFEDLNVNHKCKPCNTKAKKYWREGRKDEYNAEVQVLKEKIDRLYLEEGIKKCNTCYKIKTFSQFNIESKSWDGLQNKCKSCTQEYNSSYDPYTKESNRIQRRKRLKKRYHSDMGYRLLCTLRNDINKRLKAKNKSKKIEILGCSIAEWVVYLEQQFDEYMSWDNYGKDGYWEIDHIIPISKGGSFHYTNTQPLSIEENQKKGNRL